jgi:TonB family protein
MDLKIIVMKKPEVSDDEIRSYMNFEGLLQQRAGVLRKRARIWRAGVGFIVIASFTIIYHFTSTEQTPDQYTGNPAIVPDTTEVVHETPGMSGDTIAGIPTDEVPAMSPKDAAEKPVSKQKKEKPKEEADRAIAEKPAHSPENVYVQAEPRDGYDVLFKYFSAALQYPADAIGDSIQGTQTVSFVILADGTVDNIEMIRSLGPAFDKEALRVIREMPPWKPAMLNGKPVKSRLSLPLAFELKKIKSN